MKAETFLVENLDLEQNIAHLQNLQTDYYTEPKNETSVQIVEQKAQTLLSACSKAHGEILVTTQVKGFRKSAGTRTKFWETGNWISLPPELLDHRLLALAPREHR